MRAADLAGRRVAVWGLGREGRAAIALLRRNDPDQALIALDERPLPPGDIDCVCGAERIAAALDEIDVIVKSPGVSLYHPLLERARCKGIAVTSLLNLWFAEKPEGLRTICVTGSKGKSTTAALLAHLLRGLGGKAALAGNIGVPITEIGAADHAVIEVSSYQAADFAGTCDIALLTALFPEHLDWHGTVEAYYRDKLNLLRHARHCIVARTAADTASRLGMPAACLVPGAAGIHWRGAAFHDGGRPLGRVGNAYLARPHNLANLGLALAAAQWLGFDPAAALQAAADFRGLPHRQQELGERDGILYVDDSISTTPESTLAALQVYAGRPIAVILGGHDRGIDYDGLAAAVAGGAAVGALCLGISGARIDAALRARGAASRQVASMHEAVAAARRLVPPGGVVLLSPAAPSYGQYRDFAERGDDFAREAGFA